MPDFSSVLLTVKISGLLVLGGIIVFAIGFATHFWSYSEVYGYASEGLWFGCYKSDCREIFYYSPLPAWFIATLVLESLGLLAALLGTWLVGLYIFCSSTRQKNVFPCIVPMLACFAAAGTILLGIIIYGASVKDNLSWSFAFCTIGGIFYGTAGIFLMVAILTKKNDSEPGSGRPPSVRMSDLGAE